MLLYKHWYTRLQPFVYNSLSKPLHKFSIIIPARNEASNIGKLLDCLVCQNYPNEYFEVWIIDDFSTDNTSSIVSNFCANHPNINLLELAKILPNKPINSYKKKAIEIAISKSKFDWIITTDADCTMGNNWLAIYNNYIQQNSIVFASAPVCFTNNGSWLQTFQTLDFMALQGITAAAVSAGIHAMSNGANLLYKKEAFFAVNGFAGIDNIASGDDMLLMNKIKAKYPQQIGYLFNKEAIVYTQPMLSIKDFVNQRIRWASKTNSYKDINTKVVLWMVLLLNIGLTILPFFAFVQVDILAFWLLLILLKTYVEGSFAIYIASFFSIRLKRNYVWLQLPHIVYTAYVGILGLFGKYTWKGRVVK